MKAGPVYAIVGFMTLCLLAICFTPRGEKEAEASEPDRIRQLTQAVSAAQKEIRGLKSRITVLEGLPTAKRELAAKKRADRRR